MAAEGSSDQREKEEQHMVIEVTQDQRLESGTQMLMVESGTQIIQGMASEPVERCSAIIQACAR